MTTYTVPHVEGVPWDRWSETVIAFNPTFQNQIGLVPEADWQDWAVRLALFLPNTPRPEPFDTWQAWADALRLALFG